MPIRKNRVVNQGISNHSSVNLMRNQTSFDISTNNSIKVPNHSRNKSFNLSQSFSKFDPSRTTMTEHNPFYFSGIGQKQNKKQTLEQTNQKDIHLTKKHYKLKNQKIHQTEQLSQNSAKILDKIRKAYKYNANVHKIAKAWGFENKGYISGDQFQEIVRNHFDCSITKQNCEEMLRSVGNNRQHVDMTTFVKLVFQQEPFTKPSINVLDYKQSLQNSKVNQNLSSTLNQKISNLNEASIDHYKRNLPESKQTKFLPNLSVDIKQKRLSNSYLMFSNQQLQKTQPSLYQTMHSSSSPKFTFSTTKSHAAQFSPTIFQAINQQKTRFGATPALNLNDQSLPQNKREKIFDSKQKVLEDLISQQKLQKARYMNKLDKIRQNQHKEKEKILQMDRRIQQRDNGNMKRIREQNLAYNYVNFIHNDWK